MFNQEYAKERKNERAPIVQERERERAPILSEEREQERRSFFWLGARSGSALPKVRSA